MLKPHPSRRLQLSYFFSYLALMVVVIAVLISYSYHSFYQFHAEKLQTTYTNQLSLVKDHHEQILSSVSSMTAQIVSSAGLTSVDIVSDPVESIRAKRQLTVIKDSGSYVCGMYLKFYDSDYVFSSGSIYTLDNFTRRAALFEHLSASQLLDYFSNAQVQTVLPVQKLNGYLFNTVRDVLPVFVPVAFSSGIRCGTVLYLIEERTYTDKLQKLGLQDKDVYITSGDQLLLSHQTAAVPLNVLQNASQSSSDSFIPVRYNNQDYRLLTLKDAASAFRYYLVVPESEMQLAMAGSLQMLLLVTALAAALGLLLITQFVQSRIKPIRLIHSMLVTTNPGGNELVEIRDSVQRLIDQNISMNNKIESMESVQKAGFVQRFLNGNFSGLDEFFTAAEDIQINVDMPFFAVGILAKQASSAYDLSNDKLNRLFDEIVCGAAMTLTDRALIVAFCEDESVLFDWLAHKFEGMKACASGLAMAVSLAHQDWREGPQAYLEADHAFETRFLIGNQQILRFQTESENRQVSFMKGAPHAVEQLRLALLAGEADHVSTALNEISRLMHSTNSTLFMFRCMYNDILRVITEAARTSDLMEQDVYDLFRLSHCLCVEDLDQMLRGVCTKLIQSVHRQADSPEVPEVMARVMQLIEQRFSDPALTVSMLAEETGLSDSRLSQEFKKAYQMTPLECITSHRMRQARRLLRTTDMPIKDIAVECGYYEIPSFNRRFKAYVSMAPQQYRREHRAESGK